ncbi:MAG: VOC family protein [Actinomycetota bacterium]|nr:VOC family protein [Actinomycetota bacterium]
MSKIKEVKVWLDGVTLQVEDVEQSLDFYRRIPGAVLEHHRPGEFALLRMGEARLGLLGIGAPGFHLEVSADDVDELHVQLSRAGMEPLGPPEDRPWGERTFNVIDPDGNHIEFAGG